MTVRPGFNSEIDLELDLIPSLILGIGMGISYCEGCDNDNDNDNDLFYYSDLCYNDFVTSSIN